MELDACERIDAGLVEPWRVLAQAIAADMFAFSAILIGLRAVIGERIAETEDELQRVELEGSMRRFDTVFDRARRCRTFACSYFLTPLSAMHSRAMH